MKPKDNLMVVFEEMGGDPYGITINTVRRENVCAFSSAEQIGDVKQFKAEAGLAQNFSAPLPDPIIWCTDNKLISKVEFADYGNPTGSCGDFKKGTCKNPLTKQVVEKVIKSNYHILVALV